MGGGGRAGGPEGLSGWGGPPEGVYPIFTPYFKFTDETSENT